MINKPVLEIDNVTPCLENDEVESPVRNLKFQYVNRTYKTLSYDVTFKRPIDENVGVIN